MPLSFTSRIAFVWLQNNRRGHTLCRVGWILPNKAMAQTAAFFAAKRYAVVTGAYKGIGFEICKQLASNGIGVVLTSRNEKKGLEAAQKLKDSGFSDDQVVFHQLDVVDPYSISSLANFIRTRFGKLDILVNNAGIIGVSLNADVFQRATELSGGWPDGKKITWNKMATQNFNMAQECIKTNYYGARRMTEALVPLLELSDSARIVNISSSLGLLQFIPNEWAKQLLNDVENLTEEIVDAVVNKFLRDFQEGLLETNGWPRHLSAYKVSKAAMNAYTRIVAKRYPRFCVNCVCPGFCKTDMVTNVGVFTAAQGAEKPVTLALLPNGGPSGYFFSKLGSSYF